MASTPTVTIRAGDGESPAESIIKSAKKTAEVIDARERVITVKRLSALERMRLFASAGPELSQNQQWIGLAALAASVVSIDGDPVPKPGTRREIEFLVERLDDDGLEAVAQCYVESFGVQADELSDVAKN